MGLNSPAGTNNSLEVTLDPQFHLESQVGPLASGVFALLHLVH